MWIFCFWMISPLSASPRLKFSQPLQHLDKRDLDTMLDMELHSGSISGCLYQFGHVSFSSRTSQSSEKWVKYYLSPQCHSLAIISFLHVYHGLYVWEFKFQRGGAMLSAEYSAPETHSRYPVIICQIQWVNGVWCDGGHRGSVSLY